MTSGEKSNDNTLVQQIQNGSKEAFEVLYRRYSFRINRFVVSYLKSEEEAEELVQDVFLKLWEKKQSLDSSQNIQSYIFKIAVNTIYDFIRRKNIKEAFLELAGNGLNVSESTWDEVVYNDMLKHMNILLEKMPEQRKKIFKMSREEGLTNDEIASKLNLSKRTVENQLYRATSYLKDNMLFDSGVALLYFYLFC